MAVHSQLFWQNTEFLKFKYIEFLFLSNEYNRLYSKEQFFSRYCNSSSMNLTLSIKLLSIINTDDCELFSIYLRKIPFVLPNLSELLLRPILLIASQEKNYFPASFGINKSDPISLSPRLMLLGRLLFGRFLSSSSLKVTKIPCFQKTRPSCFGCFLHPSSNSFFM